GGDSGRPQPNQPYTYSCTYTYTHSYTYSDGPAELPYECPYEYEYEYAYVYLYGGWDLARPRSVRRRLCPSVVPSLRHPIEVDLFAPRRRFEGEQRVGQHRVHLGLGEVDVDAPLRARDLDAQLGRQAHAVDGGVLTEGRAQQHVPVCVALL